MTNKHDSRRCFAFLSLTFLTDNSLCSNESEGQYPHDDLCRIDTEMYIKGKLQMCMAMVCNHSKMVL